jgi:hypothetical protein
MITSVEELEQARNSDPRVVNGIDNANMMSVDSTEPIEIRVERLDENGKILEEEIVPAEEKEVEPAEEKEIEEKESTVVPESAKIQKRIGELTKKFRTAERERDFERAKRVETEAKLNELLSKIPTTARPVKTDFENEEDYIEALTDWKIDSKLKASQNKEAVEAATKDEKETVLATYTALDDVMEKGKEKYSDFNDLAFATDLVLSPEVVNLSLDTEYPEDVLYYLVSNPEESERISSLSDVKAAKEIGKIEVKLTGEKAVDVESKKPTAPTKKQSKAPAPISPVVTTGAVDKDPASMSAKEYRAWREKKNK